MPGAPVSGLTSKAETCIFSASQAKADETSDRISAKAIADRFGYRTPVILRQG